MSALIANAEYLNREIPTYDEVSFGVPRLVAASLAEVSTDSVEHIVISATPRAYALPVAPHAIDMMFDLMRLLGCLAYLESDTETKAPDRTVADQAADWAA